MQKDLQKLIIKVDMILKPMWKNTKRGKLEGKAPLPGSEIHRFCNYVFSTLLL